MGPIGCSLGHFSEGLLGGLRVKCGARNCIELVNGDLSCLVTSDSAVLLELYGTLDIDNSFNYSQALYN